MSARLDHGDVYEYLRAAAARAHRAPEGRDIVVSARTIEGWHYDCRRGVGTAAQGARGQGAVPSGLGMDLSTAASTTLPTERAQ